MVGIFHERLGEITHARIESAAPHRHARQEYERGVEFQCHHSRFCTGGQRVAGLRQEGFHRRHLGVDGKGAEGVHIGELGFEIAEAETRFAVGRKAQTRGVASEKFGGFHRIVAAVAAAVLDFQGGDDGIFGAGLHGAPNGLRAVGGCFVHLGAKQELVALAFPRHHLAVGEFAAVHPRAGGSGHVARGDQ